MNDKVSIPLSDVRIARDKLILDLRNTIEDSEELLRLTASQVGERVAEVRAKAEGSLRVARGHLERLQAEAVTRGKQASVEVDQYVQANPWKVVGVVGLAGLLLGTLLARR
jgi:ElaB/YqjD/DUF883 family membrane-anchored ribosome-binding protein